MSRVPVNPTHFGRTIPAWLTALHAFLSRDRDLEPRALDQDGNPTGPRAHHHYRIIRLTNTFERYGCERYATWLWVGNETGYKEYKANWPPANLPPEEEEAALHAVLEWLTPLPYYSTARPTAREELLELRGRVIRLARDRLNVLEGARPPADWEGDDWEALDPQVRRLLLYMHGRNEADLNELCPVVWGKDYAEVNDAALQTTISKANHFLRKRESDRLLSKVRGEGRLRWK